MTDNKQETITVSGYPTCACCGGSTEYKEVTKTYVNKCAHCGGKLKDNPKGVPDGEITCMSCDADYCVYCGGDKGDSSTCSKWKLTPAGGNNTNGWLNHCPQCNEDEKLQFTNGESIECQTCTAKYCPKCGKMVQAGTGIPTDSEDTTNEDGTTNSTFTPGEQLTPCPQQQEQQVEGVKIKDKTFEICIRRICAATDSVFIVENNAAFLFPYTDWMEFTLKQKINTIEKKEIDPDVFSFDYNNDGFYNKVSYHVGEYDQEVAKKDREDKDKPTGSVQYDPLVKIYGELEKEIKTPFEDEETAQYVANSLLVAYVREFNNSCKVRVLGNRKFIGGSFYQVENPFTEENELYYLQGYTTRTQKNEPLYIDLDFRYGPEGAEELADYQPYAGGASSGGVSQSGELEDIMCQVVADGGGGKYVLGCSDRTCFPGQGGDCFAWSYAFFDALDQHGWTVRIVNAPMSTDNHRQCQYKDKNGGDWQDLPYAAARECGLENEVAGTSTSGTTVTELLSNEGKVGQCAGMEVNT